MDIKLFSNILDASNAASALCALSEAPGQFDASGYDAGFAIAMFDKHGVFLGYVTEDLFTDSGL